MLFKRSNTHIRTRQLQTPFGGEVMILEVRMVDSK